MLAPKVEQWRKEGYPSADYPAVAEMFEWAHETETGEPRFLRNAFNRLYDPAAPQEDIYFTGGLTDPAKTDLWVPYVGEDGRLHRYTPDFVIRKRPPAGGRPGTGRVLRRFEQGIHP